MSTRSTWLVIPCFNEVARLSRQGISELVANDDVGVVLVDDGSDDGTRELLFDIQHLGSGVDVLVLQQNVGKAEAVRQGMEHALTLDAKIVGYLDADFATPAKDMLALVRMLETSHVKVCLGSRWLHLGAKIDRTSFRHYGGRVFATIASMVLRLSIYDTQCGAKAFRVSHALVKSLSEPFLSRWAFDVELIGRLLNDASEDARYTEQDFIEIPLQTWRDIRGSKIRFVDMVIATFELLLINSALKRWAQRTSST